MNKARILAEMEFILEDCKKENWDGYHAFPITQESFDQARRFLDLMPEELLTDCSAAPCCDGEMDFEWRPVIDRIITVDFGKNLVWAWTLGDASGCGVLEFGDEIPTEIIEKIKELC